MNNRNLISVNAQTLCNLHTRVHDAWRAGPGTPGHTAAANDFRARYDSLAFPGGLAAAQANLRRSDPATVELAIQFLEENPQFFRSGYIKEEIIRLLKRAHLSPAQRQRLVPVILRSVTEGPRRIFNECAKLSPFASSDSSIPGLNKLANSIDPEQRRRAEHIRHVLNSQPASPK